MPPRSALALVGCPSQRSTSVPESSQRQSPCHNFWRVCALHHTMKPQNCALRYLIAIWKGNLLVHLPRLASCFGNSKHSHEPQLDLLSLILLEVWNTVWSYFLRSVCDSQVFLHSLFNGAEHGKSQNMEHNSTGCRQLCHTFRNTSSTSSISRSRNRSPKASYQSRFFLWQALLEHFAQWKLIGKSCIDLELIQVDRTWKNAREAWLFELRHPSSLYPVRHIELNTICDRFEWSTPQNKQKRKQDEEQHLIWLMWTKSTSHAWCSRVPMCQTPTILFNLLQGPNNKLARLTSATQIGRSNMFGKLPAEFACFCYVSFT